MQWLDHAEAIQRCSLTLLPYATKSPRVSNADAPRLGGHHVTSCSISAMSPCTRKGRFWIHKSYLFYGFPARQVLVSGSPKEIRCLLKLTTSAEPDTIKLEDQLREIKTLTTGISLPQLHRSDDSYTGYMLPNPHESLWTCSYCPPHLEQSVSVQTRWSFPHQIPTWAVKVLPGADTLHLEDYPRKPPLTHCNQLPQNLPLFRIWWCSKVQFYIYIFLTALSMPKINVGQWIFFSSLKEWSVGI